MTIDWDEHAYPVEPSIGNFHTQRSNKKDHYAKMANMSNNHDIALDNNVSPYSILRMSNQEDIDNTIQQLTLG
jgi:hypothetical protein